MPYIQRALNELNGRKLKGASFDRRPFETLSNIGLQLELTPGIGKLRPVTPPHVAEVISVFQVIKGHQHFFRQ